MSGIKCAAMVVVGRVQGVGYRAWVAREADARALSGHVRNRPDGTVEAAFVGSDAAVDAMVRACRTGPPGADVERVDVTAGDPGSGATGFAIVR